jgi:hypothetical protein
MTERERFEAWWYSAPAEPKQAAWEAWQAALAQPARAVPTLDMLRERAERAEAALDRLANDMEFRGNSVAYIYQKKDAYAAAIDRAWTALNDAGVRADGKTSLTDGIAQLAAERNALKAQPAAQAVPSDVERDAARYRWLRGDTCPDHSPRWMEWEVRRWAAPRWTDDLRRADLDAAIDAAMLAAAPEAPA